MSNTDHPSFPIDWTPTTGDPLADVLVQHQRHKPAACLCGPLPLGSSHAKHVAQKIREAGVGGDEYHTLEELYDYRMLYNAHAAQGWAAAGIPVVKSRRHSDGEACFGGGWFIVAATLPTGQVSNHYRDEHWDLFAVPEVDLAPEYDGHTPRDAADRLRAALAQGASR